MLKVEVFYDGREDHETLGKAQKLRAKYDGRANFNIVDISKHDTPDKYGKIHAPAVVLDGMHAFKIEGPDTLSEIMRTAVQ